MSSEITIKLRNAHPPFNTWEQTGFMPFEVHGEKFAVTRIPGPLNHFQQYRATHVQTGVAVPGTDGETIEAVAKDAQQKLNEVGADKLKSALAAARKTIADGLLPA